MPNPRGFSIKVFGVDGDFFEDGKNIPTHDIEFNSAPVIDLKDAKTTREIVELRLKHGYPAKRDTLYQALDKRPDGELQKARDNLKNTHLESTRFYSQTAYRFGDYVVKYSLIPDTDTQRQLAEETVNPDQHPSSILSEWLQNFHKNHDGQFLFQVQLLENLDEQPVENAGIEWDAEKYPWQAVAKLVIPKQDSFIYERVTFWQDHMRIDPFLGLKSFEPIGSSNRLRRVGKSISECVFSRSDKLTGTSVPCQ